VWAVATGLRDRGWRSPTTDESPEGAWTLSVTGMPAPPVDTDLPLDTGELPEPEPPRACACDHVRPAFGLLGAVLLMCVRRRR
jgi:hypothetical protein